MFDWVKKLLGSSNDAEVKKLQKTVNAVEALEDEYKALTDEQLRAKTDEFRARLQNGETEDDILPEAFAAIREADARVLGMRPYRVQVMGGLVQRRHTADSSGNICGKNGADVLTIRTSKTRL